MLALLLPTAALAQCELTELVGSNSASGDVFRVIDARADIFLMGGPANDAGAPDAGAAYVFRRIGNTFVQEGPPLIASDAQVDDHFGGSGGVSMNRVVVGAGGNDEGGPNAGAAYVFRYEMSSLSWVQDTKLLAYDARPLPPYGLQFGNRAAISPSGELIAVTAAHDDQQGEDAAAVYPFRLENGTWVAESKLTWHDTEAFEEFGFALSMTDDRLLVGARSGNNPGINSGAAYVFRREGTNWVEEQKLKPCDTHEDQLFGSSAWHDENWAVVGAYGDENGAFAGAAYVYRYDPSGAPPCCNGPPWCQHQKLIASDREAGDFFGIRLGGSDVAIVIGASHDDDRGADAGAVYVFNPDDNGTPMNPADDGWVQQMKLTACDTAAGDHFGETVAIGGNFAAITALCGDTDVGVDTGSVYVFDIAECPGPDCNANGIPDECDISSCAGDPACGDCNANGIPDGCDIADCTGDPSCQDCNGDGRPDECGVIASCELRKLTSADGAADDLFGSSVSIFGDSILVGAYYHQDAFIHQGAAYVFVRDGSGWVQQAKLTASDAAAFDVFGSAVAISADTAVVGAPDKDAGPGVRQGSAYIFLRNGSAWAESAKLTPSDGAPFDQFGSVVSISDSGETVVIGSPGKSNGHGAAYVFVRPQSGWTHMTQTAKLSASDADEGHWFGTNVSVSGDIIVVGAWGDDGASNDEGSAYVFAKLAGGWTNMTETAKLVASDAEPNDRFGALVSTSGDTIVVGAHLDDGASSDEGSAYIFVKPTGGWSGTLHEDAKLTAADGAAQDWFGWSAAISGNAIVVSASRDDVVVPDQGSVYVFMRPAGGWSTAQESRKLVASDASQGDALGYATAIAGSTVVVGASYDLERRGSAYIFVLDAPDCDCNGAADACDIADGTSLDCNGNGIPDECDIANCTGDPACDDCNGNGVPDECDSVPVCADGNACTCDECVSGGCQHTPIRFGDVNCSGGPSVDLDDILCVLDGFTNFSVCPNADIAPTCAGDGGIDLDDILAVLDAFGGADPCGCGP